VQAGPQRPDDLGTLYGCLGAVVALFVWFGAGALILASSHGCQNFWLPRVYYLGTIVFCVAALWAGVRAARGGQPGIAVLLLAPAIVVLLPATACAVSALSTCR
jgi:energy-converting hydrogenase Eha subunit H